MFIFPFLSLLALFLVNFIPGTCTRKFTGENLILRSLLVFFYFSLHSFSKFKYVLSHSFPTAFAITLGTSVSIFCWGSFLMWPWILFLTSFREKMIYAPFSKILSAFISSLFFLIHICRILILPMLKFILFSSTIFCNPGSLNCLFLALQTPLRVPVGTFQQNTSTAFTSSSVGPGILQQSRYITISQFLFHEHKGGGKFISMLLWPLKSLLSFPIHLFSEIITFLFQNPTPTNWLDLPRMGDLNYRIVHRRFYCSVKAEDHWFTYLILLQASPFYCNSCLHIHLPYLARVYCRQGRLIQLWLISI